MQTHHIPDNWRVETRREGIAVFDDTGKARCGSLCRNGKPCGQPPIIGAFRCRMHNGNSIKGEAHPNYKHGEQSRYAMRLPNRLKERYQRLLESDNLGNLSENLALLDVRIQMLLERMDAGEFGASYNQLRSMHTRAERAMDTAFHGLDADDRKKALADFVALFNEMGALIATGQKDYQTWSQILDVTAERRQVTKAMADIEHKGENSVPVSEVWSLLQEIKDIFDKANRYDNPDERKKEMSRGLSNIINFRAG